MLTEKQMNLLLHHLQEASEYAFLDAEGATDDDDTREAFKEAETEIDSLIKILEKEPVLKECPIHIYGQQGETSVATNQKLLVFFNFMGKSGCATMRVDDIIKMWDEFEKQGYPLQLELQGSLTVPVMNAEEMYNAFWSEIDDSESSVPMYQPIGWFPKLSFED